MSATKIRSLVLSKLFGLGWVCLAFAPELVPAQLIQNGSFELPTGGGGSDFEWMICAGDPDTQVLDGNGPGVLGIHTPPANGLHYLGMLSSATGMSEAIGQPMGLEAGSLYYGSIELFRSMAHQNWDGMSQLEIWGGTDCNGLRELLWTSGNVSNLDDWQTYPIAFTPLENHAWMSIVARIQSGSGQMAYLCLDDLKLSNTYFAIDFVGFEVESQGAAAKLRWETVPLQDDLRFDVEWSQDGSQFEKVGSLEARRGDQSFTYTHVCGRAGQQYYRVSSVDRGGHEDLSEIRAVVVTESSINVYPNPATTQLSIISGDVNAPLTDVALLDLQGRECHRWTGNGVLQMGIDLPSQLSRGCYFLQVTAGKKTMTHRLTLL